MTQGSDPPQRLGVHASTDGHVHLHVIEKSAPKPKWDWAHWLVLAMGLGAVGFFCAAFFFPWWSFKLYAPQYPKGLLLVISLTGMSGDVHEIDLLNHYIGMKHLTDAASVERHLASYGVAGVAVLTLAFLMLAGKKLNKIVFAPAVAFPILFLADSFYWLYSFGHQLDPKAPLRIGAFTPQMFGNGQIGQFETFANPSVGFWLAIAGVTCAVIGSIVRSRVCAHCGHANECSAVCPRVMVLPDGEKVHT